MLVTNSWRWLLRVKAETVHKNPGLVICPRNPRDISYNPRGSTPRGKCSRSICYDEKGEIDRLSKTLKGTDDVRIEVDIERLTLEREKMQLERGEKKKDRETRGLELQHEGELRREKRESNAKLELE